MASHESDDPAAAEGGRGPGAKGSGAGESVEGGPPDERDTYVGPAHPPGRARSEPSSAATSGGSATTGDPHNTFHSPSTVEQDGRRRRSSQPVAPVLIGERYKVHRLLARGGQGEVWVVTDELLGQERALKIVQPQARPSSVERFRREIERTVLLAHPGVVPVFDRGETRDGRPWFVMRRVHGNNLDDVISALFAGQGRFNLRRIVELLVGLCAAVEHAHRHRTLHRDLKPRNVMISEFDEALCMDWGLAEDLPDPSPPRTMARKGQPAGTRGYIAPECRLDPDHLHRQVDVFGLGAILYKALTGRDPPEERPPVSHDFGETWADGELLPDELIDICLAATAPAPSARLASAGKLRQRLVDWLDGARRRDEALTMVERARLLLPGIRTERERVDALLRRAATARQGVPDHAPASARYPAWALEDDAQAAEDALALMELEVERLLGAAQVRAPDLAEAHALLALHHRERAEAAEAAEQRATARRAEALVRRHQRGEHAEWLAGHGTFDLRTLPSGARVTLHPLVLDKRRLVLGPGEPPRSTPLVGCRLPRGSYLARVESAQHPPMRYPVVLDRGEHWSGIPPGEDRPLPIPLITPADGAVYVPAGPAWLGGDPEAAVPLPRCRIWVDGFVMQRFPVTHRQWIAFLDDLADRGDDAALARHQPRHRDGRAVYLLGSDGQRQIHVDLEGEPSSLDVPVSLIDWHSAGAYARWLADRTGHAWRLPTAYEWEKAARGVDGRSLPWGEEPEPSWSCTVAAFDGRPYPTPVGHCPEDESVYGVRDMAGSVRNWCSNSFAPDPPPDGRDRIRPPEGDRREVRGGSWGSQPSVCRPAGRLASGVDQRFRSIGVRLVYSVR